MQQVEMLNHRGGPGQMDLCLMLNPPCGLGQAVN